MDDPSTYYTPLRMSRPWTPGSGGGGGAGITFNKIVANLTATNPVAVDPAATANDVLIAIGVTDAGLAVTWTWPASFTQLANASLNVNDGGTFGASRKLASTGSEGSLNISNDGASSILGAIASFTGVNNTTPEDVTPVLVVDNVNSFSAWTVSGSITPVTNGCMIVAIMFSDNGVAGDVVHDFTTTSGTTGAWTVQGDPADVSGTRNFALANCIQTVAGPITVQGRGTLSGQADKTLLLIALRPA